MMLRRDDKEMLEQVRARVARTLDIGPQFETSSSMAERFLRRHVNKKIKLVTLTADIAGSTRMSFTLPTHVLASIIQVFSQEMALIVTGYGGYVLKYVGDAILAFFPAEFDSKRACINAINCALAMQRITNECINPELVNIGYPHIKIKIGIDFGEDLVVLYGKSNTNSYIDVVGTSISMASKISSVAPPERIVIGQEAYNLLDDMKAKFYETEDIGVSNFDKNEFTYKLYVMRDNTETEIIEGKTIFYNVIEEIGNEDIELSLSGSKESVSSIIKRIYTSCLSYIESLDVKREEKERLYKEITKALLHYVLAKCMIQSERDVEYDSIKLDIVIPSTRQLKTSPERTLLLAIPDETFSIEPLLKVQKKENIWILLGYINKRIIDLCQGLRIYIPDQYADDLRPLSSIVEDIKEFLLSKNVKSFRIFPTK